LLLVPLLHLVCCCLAVYQSHTNLQLGVAKDIIAKDGFGSLYKGLSAGLLRQATYTTARLGIFSQITEVAKKANDGKNLPLWQKAACGLAAGGLGALVGTPADLTLLRMQVTMAADAHV
jgi:solute carrier family 25 oxoglutarate transporter 11